MKCMMINSRLNPIDSLTTPSHHFPYHRYYLKWMKSWVPTKLIKLANWNLCVGQSLQIDDKCSIQFKDEFMWFLLCIVIRMLTSISAIISFQSIGLDCFSANYDIINHQLPLLPYSKFDRDFQPSDMYKFCKTVFLRQWQTLPWGQSLHHRSGIPSDWKNGGHATDLSALLHKSKLQIC